MTIEAAADVLQETFVRIHDGIDGLRDDDRIVAWVYRIARNAIADHHRAASRAMEMAEVERLPQQVVADRLGLSLSGAKSRIQRGRAMLRSCCHVDLDRYGNVVDYRRHGACCVCCPRGEPGPRTP